MIDEERINQARERHEQALKYWGSRGLMPAESDRAFLLGVIDNLRTMLQETTENAWKVYALTNGGQSVGPAREAWGGLCAQLNENDRRLDV